MARSLALLWLIALTCVSCAAITGEETQPPSGVEGGGPSPAVLAQAGFTGEEAFF